MSASASSFSEKKGDNASPFKTGSLIEQWLPKRWHARYQRWMDKRIPPTRRVTLHQKNLFIFLSPQGAAYLFLTVLVWIGATNYQNNLVMALCFLLLAILFVAIHQTFANLSGLSLRFVSAEPVFAGDAAQFTLELHASSARQQLFLAWPCEQDAVVSLHKNEPAYCQLSVVTRRRGVYRPGRFRLQTVYPLGIIRCWTWLDLQAEVLVYPKPIEADYRDFASGASDDAGLMVAGAEDFFALKSYVEGDPLSRVAWKQYAAGRGLFVREYVDYRGSDIWLDYQAVPHPDSEVRLSMLCFCALAIAETGRPYGVRLPQVHIDPAAGIEHTQRVLRALAESSA